MAKRTKLSEITEDLTLLKRKLIYREPSDFGYKDIARAFFGAVIIGLTFVFKGTLVTTSNILTNTHITWIIISTLLILTIEIFFIGYRRVHEKDQRKPLQFVLKRLITFYFISILVALYLVFIFAINLQVAGSFAVFKLIVILSMPCAIGASLADLLKQY